MSYEIGQSERTGVLRIRYSGIVDERTWRRALTETIERIRQGKVFGLLFDFSATDAPMSITEHYDYLETMAAAALIIGKRAAFLQKEKDDELWRFIETVGFNRGLDVKAFADGAEALAWIEARVRGAAPGNEP